MSCQSSSAVEGLGLQQRKKSIEQRKKELELEEREVEKLERLEKELALARERGLESHFAVGPSVSTSLPSSSLPFCGPSGNFQLSSSPNSRGGLNAPNHARRLSVPRTASAVSGRHLSALSGYGTPTTNVAGADSQAMKRAKTSHQTPRNRHQSMTMARANSSRSVRSNPPAAIPFSGSRQITPPPLTQHNVLGRALMIDNYSNGRTPAPATESLYSHALGPSAASSLTEQPTSHDNSMHVGQYLMLHGLDGDIAPISAPTMDITALQPLSMFQDYTQSACGSLTEATSFEEVSMSRENSITMASVDNLSVNKHMSGDMVRIASQSSYQNGVAGFAQDSFTLESSPSSLGKRHSPMDQHDFSQIGANLSAQLSQAYSASTPAMHHHHVAMQRSDSSASADSINFQPPDCVTGSVPSAALCHASSTMERTESNRSTKSSMSLKLQYRAKESLNRQNQNAKKAQLKPKPASPAEGNCPGSTAGARAGAIATGGSSVAAGNKSGKEGKAAISAAKKYERPKHPKVRCRHCNEYPEGFRGEHELRRHQDAKHKDTVVKYVCRDPRKSKGANATKLSPIQPLEDCKQCKQGKQYGAYYNAAAHLRRTHFKEKPTRVRNPTGTSSKGSKGTKDGDADLSGTSASSVGRGGKGGGDYPPMNELKDWMEEIRVPADGSTAIADSMNDMKVEPEVEPEAEEDCLEDFDMDMHQTPASATEILPASYHSVSANDLAGISYNHFASLGAGDYQMLPEILGDSEQLLLHNGVAHGGYGGAVSAGAVPGGMLISSANFDFCHPINTSLGHSAPTAASDIYHSSSTPTITPGHFYPDSPQYSTAGAGNGPVFSPEDPQEFDFAAAMASY